MSSTRVFVYGTLKRGMRNAHYLAGQTFLGEARTRPVYRMFSFVTHPGVIEAPEGGFSLMGEVWEVDEACKKRLDVLEGIAIGEYTLAPAKLEPPFDEAPTWIYLYAQDVSSALDGGANWRDPK